MPSWAITLIQTALPIIINEINAIIALIQQQQNGQSTPAQSAQLKSLMDMQTAMITGIAAHSGNGAAA